MTASGTLLPFWLCQGKRPRAVQDFGSRAKEAYGVIPSLRDREAIRHLSVASTELDGDRTVGSLFGGDAVHRISIVLVWLQVSLAVVDGERPETIDGDVPDR